MAALLREFPPGDPLAEVVLVMSEKARARALETARAAGIEVRHLPWSDRASFENAATALCEERGIDLICLAGFMKLLSPQFVMRWRGRLLNVHPSLLPAFRGLNAHRQALEAGASESGCSVHFVDAGVDSGKVILQRRVPIMPGDDEERLAQRILEQEHSAYPEAVRLVLAGRAKPEEAEEGQ